MSDQKKPFYKNYLVIILFGIIFSWFLIYYVWASYPSRIIKDDTVNSKDLPANIWKGIPYLPPKEKEIEGNSYYSALGSTYGTYGDMYGSLNTLFSGLAFATLIISLLLQMLELRETRKELANQSKALLDQKTEFSAQTKILEKQTGINTNQQKIIDDQFKETQKTNFLNHFFKLIDQKHILLNNLTFPKNNEQIHGISVIIEYANEFRRIRKKFDPQEHGRDFYSEAWDDFNKRHYGSYNYQVRSYFKIYRLIIYIIHTSKILSANEKKYYGTVFRTFLSTEEQLVLMWLATFENGLNNCCNRYSLLKGLYNEEMKKTGVTFFKITAFDDMDPNWKSAFEEAESEKQKSE
ncbi:putative phage abortive infection protein [Acinetobacter baumannii]|nr:putative phage abortive infection protein [Acinetobacter baumannii]